ncbi:HEPN domain-containing protein [Dysgonomonas alginatilytica]|uniref:HEPN domain-containing protein n=1 Tax=Dysgonomonas alginatilytica TaxID=1605892 RepID=A0A2V3PTF2_9BACT|nr:HEPN domain-containing protein [Dysgonomonas alginatilytica]PXV62471.1 HEPN domain-containing protein [Dysgonomonas alginatilytica]
MKRSIAYLPKNKQQDLYFIINEIKKRLPQTEMIILYGSYARDQFVDFDEREEFGIITSFRSDYDVLVVTSGISDKSAGQKLDNVENIYYKDPEGQTPLQFINEDIKTLNKLIEEGRYFYTQIKQEGVILYDSGKHKLARRRKLNFDEIRQQAQEYFNQKFRKANGFFDGVEFYSSKKDYQLASFNLHQAAENYYHAIHLVFTLKDTKQHNLFKLSSSVKHYSTDLTKVFPQNTAEEKRLFNLLKDAYVEARYNADFLVTKEDIDALIPKVELLRDITKQICEKKIAEYTQM